MTRRTLVASLVAPLLLAAAIARADDVAPAGDAAPAPAPPAAGTAHTADASPADDGTISDEELAALLAAAETIEIVDRAPPGAHAELGREVLERMERDDIHKVLAHVAGVYLREEDGYGLRPNIGMRGAAAERSAKVALMEDGVLIAPAPYSAPAAYYFPLVTRMSKVEVVKGPSAVMYGPNTVGGAVNLVGEPMPDDAGDRVGYVDAALGSDLYGKLHGRIAEVGTWWGVMAEYVKLRTDGFKDVDGGGPSGFDKDDAQLWLRARTDPAARNTQQLDVKVGWAREDSDETYTGLTDGDFARAPQRRYRSTADDHMAWDHLRLRLVHRVTLGTSVRLETTAYRHDFHRVWSKLDGFASQRDLRAILANPTAGTNALYYAILTGEADSTSPEEQLLIGTNDRTFVSQGVQTTLGADATLGPTYHAIDAGVRLHLDRADRIRREDLRAMTGGDMLDTDRPTMTVLDSRAETVALAAHVRDQVRWGRVELTAGTRVEAILTSFDDHLTATGASDTYGVIIPGGGAIVDVTDELALLAGVHRGFTPVAPGSTTDASPESSVNWEAGARWRSDGLAADLVGFFSDYANLKGTCTFSSGCLAEQEGDEFDGGRVHVYGLEAQAAAEWAATERLRVPVQATYTLTRSSFQSAFTSDFAGWGDVMVGDELPYLPVHQLALAASVVDPRWEVGAGATYHSAMRDVAGQGEVAPEDRTESLLTFNLNAHVRVRPWAELYLTCDNLLNEQAIVSRRPYGARPNAPRIVIAGYKARF